MIDQNLFGKITDNSLFAEMYPDIKYLEQSGYTIRLDTKVMLENEIRVDRKTKRVVNDLINYLKRNRGYGVYNANLRIKKEIEKVVKNNLNSQWSFAGKTGSGKSEFAQKLGFVHINAYHEFARQNPDNPKSKLYANAKLKVGFKIDECNDLAKQMTPGDILIRDEQSDTSGEGSRIEKEANENLRKAVRGKNINFFDCQPKVDFTDTTNILFLVLGYHPKSMKSIALVYVPFSSTKSASLIMEAIGYVIIKKHDNEAFRKDYEDRKQKYIEELLKTGGIESISIRPEELENHAMTLINYLREKDIMPANNTEWELYLDLAGIPRKSTNYPRKVIALTKKRYKPKQPEIIEEKEIDLSQLETGKDLIKQFDFNPVEEVLFIDQSNRDKEIYVKYYRGIAQSKIARELNLSAQRISQIINSVESSLNYRMGHKFEDFAKAVYQKKDYDIVFFSEQRLKNEPDLIIKKNGLIEIISLKCSVSTRKDIIPIDDCKPELKEYIKRKKAGENVKCYLEFLNIADNNNKIHRKIEIDEQNYKVTIPLR